MRKLLLTTVIALLSMAGAMAQQYDFSAVSDDDTLYYKITDASAKTVEVVSENSTYPYYTTKPTGTLSIPETVTYDSNTYTVTSIGKNAFNACSGLKSGLTIPNSVTSIGESAFYNCSGFTGSLTIGNSVTSIGASAFRGCNGFTGSLTIGNSVTSIENEAFYACSGFKGSLTIPNSVTSIGYSAFNYCTGLTDLTMLNLTPPTVGRYVFDNVTFTAVSVPAGAVAAYDAQTLNGDADSDGLWQGLTIEESVSTSVASAQVVPFTRIQNTLYFAQPTAVAVYNVSGVMLHSGEVMEYTLPNAAGVYIIRTAHSSVKVVLSN